jgi:hypothetical protein
MTKVVNKAKGGRKRTSGSLKIKSFNEIERHWGDVPVVDATQELRVFIQPEDVASATRKDPGACVFANACKRQFAATKVLFLKEVAYVELPTRTGERRVERFRMTPAMRGLVENFDRGKPVDGVAGFELKPMKPSETFVGKADRRRRQREHHRAALLDGTRTPVRGKQGQGAYSKPVIVVDLEVRDGRGRVRFKRTAGRS